jgi:hypothetical protein
MSGGRILVGAAYVFSWSYVLHASAVEGIFSTGDKEAIRSEGEAIVLPSSARE